jgi:glycosyltransferase involved in cell wall biosynthesis
VIRVAIVARAVHPFHGVGGLERSVADLAHHLAREGVRVTLITRTPDAVQGADGFHPDARVIFVPYRTFPFANRRGTTILDRSTAYPLFGLRAGAVAADLVHRNEIDIVHGFGASVLGYARRRRSEKAPLVLNPQGLEEFGGTDPQRARLKRAFYLPLRRAVRACARSADRVIATDRALVPAVREHLSVPEDRIRTIPNGVDLEALDRIAHRSDPARVKASARIGPNDQVLLSVGRLEENKGFHVMVAALAALRAHGSSSASVGWKWVLVGDGPYRTRIEAWIRNANLAEHVVLTGRVDDVTLHSWYDAAALFVHPTLYEGSSLVTLEVMAHRRAVVATGAGGLPDKVRPGVNGWLVPPGRPDALAAALSGALGSLSLLPAMGAASRRIVEEEFAWPILARAHVSMYRELLELTEVVP